MSFDGVFLHTLVNELHQELGSAKLSKIQQPYEKELVLVFRANGRNVKLLLSAHPTYARVQLTQLTYQNPATPPNFCMMLRKYLEGSILQGIEQVENDRILYLDFSKRDELGDLDHYRLIIELMGRHSTICLVQKATGKIIDAIKHIGPSVNSYRLLLPGATYQLPPQGEQWNPFTLTAETRLFEWLKTQQPITAKALQQQFQGIGRDTAIELAARLAAQPQAMLQVWQNFWSAFASPQPTAVFAANGKDQFSAIPYRTVEGQAESFPSLSTLLDAIYTGKAERDRVKQQFGQIIQRLENEKKRGQNKLKKLTQTLAESEHAEIFRQKGELLTTYLHQVPRGAQTVTLENYYEENQPLEIELNPALSPNQNAQKYFQRYQKLKKGVKIIQDQLVQTEATISYIDSLLSEVELATPADLEILREELRSQGYLKEQKQRKKVLKKSQPEQFFASDGTSILVGKNNLQNDHLTLRTARKSDIWLHAKDIPGSHVIIQEAQPSAQTLEEAAHLAAYFSRYRLSSHVPVDYVAVKAIHKPNGAKPGFVIYEGQKTIQVTPTEELVDQLRQPPVSK